MVELSPRAAAEVARLQRLQDNPNARLRFFVEAGGCSGWEYAMGFGEPLPGDVENPSGGVSLFVPSADLPRLDGVRIDFDDGLMGKGFEIHNPRAHSTCGCGRSFN